MATAINWPSTLPGHPIGSWSYKPQTSIIKSNMEVGEPKRRLRTTALYKKFSGTLEMSAAQVETFITFVETTLNNGVLTFNWPDFINDETVEVCLDINTNGALYNLTQISEYVYEVTLQLEIKP
jgi:hypothetical protein